MHLLENNPDAELTIVLAHGAGAPMDSPFMNGMAQRLADAGLHVVRFEFPYMAERRKDGKKRGPNGQKVLEQTWREVYERFAPCLIGGKSMGGRYASMLADELAPLGVVCLGYPFHPPGKPEKLRTDHLRALQTPTLVLQGTRDPFGKPQEVEGYDLSNRIHVTWVEAGDHSFEPTKRSGRTIEQNLDFAADCIAEFVSELGVS